MIASYCIIQHFTHEHLVPAIKSVLIDQGHANASMRPFPRFRYATESFPLPIHTPRSSLECSACYFTHDFTDERGCG
jgi:hypothetical protein